MNNERPRPVHECTPAVSRRAVLKIAAGAPLVLTFALLASPLARFLKPTMKAGGFFQAPDMPTAEHSVEFNMTEFPADWTCKPFELHMKYVVFNPEQDQIRKIPGLAVRLAPSNVVAFSRICPNDGCILKFKTEACCGCIQSAVGPCQCAQKISKPVLVCANDYCAFDLTRGGRALSGYARRPLRQFVVRQQAFSISINGFEATGIA